MSKKLFSLLNKVLQIYQNMKLIFILLLFFFLIVKTFIFRISQLDSVWC